MNILKKTIAWLQGIDERTSILYESSRCYVKRDIADCPYLENVAYLIEEKNGWVKLRTIPTWKIGKSTFEAIYEREFAMKRETFDKEYIVYKPLDN